VLYLFWLVNVCFCCVRFCFSIPNQAIGLARQTSPKWPILCWVGRKTLTQWINPALVTVNCDRDLWTRSRQCQGEWVSEWAVKENQCAKYLCQTLRSSKLLSQRTDTHTHIGPTALAEPLRWSTISHCDWRSQDLVWGGGQKLRENYLSHIKWHEIIQWTNMFGEATTQSHCQTLCSSKVNWKINCWKSRGHAPQCPIDGDANGHPCDFGDYVSNRQSRNIAVYRN